MTKTWLLQLKFAKSKFLNQLLVVRIRIKNKIDTYCGGGGGGGSGGVQSECTAANEPTNQQQPAER
jgi:hypothetical protein